MSKPFSSSYVSHATRRSVTTSSPRVRHCHAAMTSTQLLPAHEQAGQLVEQRVDRVAGRIQRAAAIRMASKRSWSQTGIAGRRDQLLEARERRLGVPARRRDLHPGAVALVEDEAARRLADDQLAALPQDRARLGVRRLPGEAALGDAQHRAAVGAPR